MSYKDFDPAIIRVVICISLFIRLSWPEVLLTCQFVWSYVLKHSVFVLMFRKQNRIFWIP